MFFESKSIAVNKFHLAFMLICFSLSSVLTAQDCEWITASEAGGNVSPAGTSNSAVHFFNAAEGIVGGANGRLLRTDDGGLTWSQVDGIPNLGVAAFSFPENNTGYAVGNQGMILRTDDAGNSWEVLESGVFSVFNGVYFTDADTGVAVGNNGVIRRTDDGGETWTTIPSGVTANLNDVFFIDGNTGWAAGAGHTVLHTNDAGLTWTEQEVSGSGTIRGLHFTDAMTGFAASSGSTLLQTSDGGETWTSSFVAGVSLVLYSVFFTDSQHGWICGDGGFVKFTTDGGQTWIDGNAGTTLRWQGIYFTNNNTGWLVGQNGGIMSTADGGQTWSHQIIGKTAFFDVAYVSDAKILAAGSPGFLLMSENGGVNWTVKSYGSLSTMEAIHVFSEDLIWAAGHNGTIVRSNDGGETWTPQITGFNGQFRDICFATSEKGWAVGSQGMIRTTNDGGENWLPQTSGTTQTLNAVHFLSENTGFAAGQNSTLLRTTDGGQNWNPISPEFSNHVLSIFFLDNENGWISGAAGNLSHTTDGGDTWTSQPVGTSNWLQDVHFISETEGYVVGGGGSIRHTTDGGSSWTEVPSLGNQAYNAVDFRNAGRGIAVGAADIRLYSCCQPSFGTETYSGCSGDGYSVTVGGTVYDEANPGGTAFFPEGSASGCDSTVTVTLQFSPSATGTDVVIICGSYTWIDGIEYTESNTSAIYTIEGGAANGCDSIVTLDLTVFPIPEGVDEVTSCGPFVWIDGNTYSESNNTATYPMKSAAINGCDSIAMLDLTVIDINTEVAAGGGALSAAQEGAEYQWFECVDDGFLLIEGADAPSFLPSENGAYSVEITVGPCIEISECEEVFGLSASGTAGPTFRIYPNPARDLLYVESSAAGDAVQLVLYDISGRPLRSVQSTGVLTELSLSGLAAGTYLLRGGVAGAVRVVVQ